MNERIRARVRQEMTRQGLSQRELARRLGISPPALSQILSGKYGAIPESLLDLLGGLGLTLEAVPVKDLEPVPEPEPTRRGRPRSVPAERQDAEEGTGQDAPPAPEAAPIRKGRGHPLPGISAEEGT